MTFARRYINLTFQLGRGSFGNSGYDTVKLTGLRASAHISKAGGVSLSHCDLRVYGMSLSQMNQLSTLGKPLMSGRNNKVTVEAGDTVSGSSVAFVGTIQEAWVASDAPENVFLVQAFTGLLDKLRVLPPASYAGHADAATICASLATQMGYSFENNGVNVQLSNPYFWGTGRQQLESAARAGNFNFFIDDAKNTLAIWPKGSSRGGVIPVIGPSKLLVGYPKFTQNGLIVNTEYNPNISFGGNIQVQSALLPANGPAWTVFSVAHDLESETPGGKWFTQAQCSWLGHTAIDGG